MTDSSGYISIRQLLDSFGWSSSEESQQQDIHEIIKMLFDSIEKNSKIIDKLFGGLQNNKIKCLKVDYESSKKEKFYDLRLDINECKNIYQSFDKLVKGDLLDGDNQYNTEDYGKQDARIFPELIQMPQVLFLHLNRLEFSLYAKKITQDYEFYKEIDLKKWTGMDDSLYVLQSVLVHQGLSANSGHYYAHIKIGGQWYEFNDEVVSKISEFKAIECNYGGDSCAYVLVYLKKSEMKKILEEKDIPKKTRDKFVSKCSIL